MAIGSKIKRLRELKGITQSELAASINSTKQTIFKYENGIITNIPMDKLTIIARVLGCSPAYLLGWTEIENDISSKCTKPATTDIANICSVDGITEFNVIGTILAGYNGALEEVETGDRIQIPTAMLRGRAPSEFFTLRIKGNSMYPRLLENDIVLCLRSTSVDSGSIAVVLYNSDEATVKKVRYNSGEDWMELVPFNPEYPTKKITGAALNECRILGLVVKLIRDL